MRTHHYNTGVRVRIANGFWLGGSQSHSYRAREIVDRGMVAITTRRIAYVGAEMTAQVMFDDLMSIEGDLDCNLLHSARRQSAMMINYSDAFLGLLLVRLLASSAVLRDNRLPTGWRVGVDRQGDQVKVRLDGPRAALAG